MQSLLPPSPPAQFLHKIAPSQPALFSRARASCKSASAAWEEHRENVDINFRCHFDVTVIFVRQCSGRQTTTEAVNFLYYLIIFTTDSHNV